MQQRCFNKIFWKGVSSCAFIAGLELMYVNKQKWCPTTNVECYFLLRPCFSGQFFDVMHHLTYVSFEILFFLILDRSLSYHWSKKHLAKSVLLVFDYFGTKWFYTGVFKFSARKLSLFFSAEEIQEETVKYVIIVLVTIYESRHSHIYCIHLVSYHSGSSCYRGRLAMASSNMQLSGINSITLSRTCFLQLHTWP